MKFAVRYQSRGGNTRAVAEIIADVLGIKAETIDTALDEKVDTLFIGGGLYAGHIDKKLKIYMENIDPERVGKIVPFGTAGGRQFALKEIAECAAKKGIKVDEHRLCVKMWLKGYSFFKFNGGKLNEKQINTIKEFTNGIMQNN
jgi:flavodoxin